MVNIHHTSGVIVHTHALKCLCFVNYCSFVRFYSPLDQYCKDLDLESYVYNVAETTTQSGITSSSTVVIVVQ